MIATVDDACLQGIKDPTTELHNVTLLQMLEYLYDNYGKINKESKNKNIERMKEPNSITTLIKLQEWIYFTSATQIPLITAQILDSALLKLVFNTECHKWRKKSAIDKTWDNLQTFFKEAHNNLREGMKNKYTGFYIKI